ncbi:MAG: 6-pyruvoyl-tetrahydropterin synthase-related protein [Syntrophales bacterium]|nr:6-pyruvoyl-tetrahydropterin synthase-related protein [Syntrophales bacterium]
MTMKSEAGQSKLESLTDITVLCLIVFFLFSYFRPEYLFSPTTTTGGDTGSHYATAQYMRNVLLPQGRITGWMMGNYAGFPLFQFYFPLPFIVMALLSHAIPLQIAFKLITILGVVTLPLCCYAALRLMDQRFPVPASGAIFSLLFLFMEANSMWGGNILSTLAGEFAYGIGMSLAVLFAGTLYRGIPNDRHLALNAVLIFLIGFSHGYALLFAVAMTSFFLFDRVSFLRNGIYLFKMHGLGFLLLGFWLIPLIGKITYTTAYADRWFIKSLLEIFPPILWPAMVLAVAGLVAIVFLCIRRPEAIRRFAGAGKAAAFFAYVIALCWICYHVAPQIGVTDIRFLPFMQVFMMLTGALGLGVLTAPLKHRWAAPMVLLICVLPCISHLEKNISAWISWNYNGFETKGLWPAFREVNQYLKGSVGDPRVVYEHSSLHNGAGTTRAFESLPFFSGRSTLEGVYMQSSISSPFVFYIQSEISKESSRPFPQYRYSNVDLAAGIEHLKLFNVRDFVVISPEIREMIQAFPEFRLKKVVFPYWVYELTTNANRYVIPLEFKPVLCEAKDWKGASFRWFQTYKKNRGIHLVFDPGGATDRSRFKAAVPSFPPPMPEGLSGEEAPSVSLPRIPVGRTCSVSEEIRDEEIIIKTSDPGVPLLIKVSYHPNWKVEGADRIYLVSPSFMLIYPNRPDVRLSFGRTAWDYLGYAMTSAGILILLWIGILRMKGKKYPEKEKGEGACDGLPGFILRNQGRIVVALGLLALLGAAALLTSSGEGVSVLIHKGILCKDCGKLEEARAVFKDVEEKFPDHPRADEAAYYYGICWYKDNNWQKAIEAFHVLIEQYPGSSWIPEAYFHVGKSHGYLGERKQANAIFDRIIRDYPETPWAVYAAQWKK